MTNWKLIGLAGVASVAAVGVAVARNKRDWTEASPEELREYAH